MSADRWCPECDAVLVQGTDGGWRCTRYECVHGVLPVLLDADGEPVPQPTLVHVNATATLDHAAAAVLGAVKAERDAARDELAREMEDHGVALARLDAALRQLEDVTAERDVLAEWRDVWGPDVDLWKRVYARTASAASDAELAGFVRQLARDYYVEERARMKRLIAATDAARARDAGNC